MNPEMLDQLFVERVVTEIIFGIGGRMFWGRYLFVSLSSYLLAALAAAVWRVMEQVI